MNEIPGVNAHLRRMLAYAKGRQAFDEKRWRALYLYKNTHEKLASDWWDGWDQTKEESKRERTPFKESPP